MKINPYFKFGNGDIDETCLKEISKNPGVFLNRSGTVRLLNATRRHCSFLKPKENNRKSHSQNHSENIINYPDAYTHQDHNGAYENSAKVQRYQDMQDGIVHYDNSQPSFNVHQRSSRNHQQRQQSRRRSQSMMREEIPRTRQHPTVDFQGRRKEMNTYRNERKRGCYNCGEQNHQQDHCWFDNRVKCGNCGMLGHKSKLCSFYR